MSRFVQPLENRVLMSVTSATLTADSNAVINDSATTRSALLAQHSAELSFRAQTITALKALEKSSPSTRAADNRLIAALTSATNSNFAKLLSADNSYLASAKSLSLTGAADGRAVLLHPTKVALQTKVTRDIAALNSVIPSKLSAVQSAAANEVAAVNTAYTNIVAADAALAGAVQTGQGTVATAAATFAASASQVQTDTNQLSTDLGNPTTTPAVVTLTGVTLFRGNSSGNNLDTVGNAIGHGGWTTGLDVQNVPGNYGAELFISKIPNPTPADFLTPGTLAASLISGANTFYFFADGDDTLGGNATFGMNIFLNGAGVSSPTLSGYTVPGTGQTLLADSAASTAGATFVVTPGAGTLSVPNGTSGSVTLSSFQVLGVSGQGSTVDLVNSTNTAPFTPPAHADGVPDTYGTFTITVSP